MPRGNDANAAAAELADRFGQGVGRAEELIQASRREYSPLLRSAQLQPVDDEATEALTKEDVAKSADLDEVDVLDYAVHGQGRDKTVIVVFNDEEGRTHKDAFPLDVAGKAPSTVEKAVAEAEGEDEKPAAKKPARKKPAKKS